jgi:hypothetical protein
MGLPGVVRQREEKARIRVFFLLRPALSLFLLPHSFLASRSRAQNREKARAPTIGQKKP